MKFSAVLLLIGVLASTNAQDGEVTRAPIEVTKVPCEPLDCSQIGDWDQESCQCIQIICDPAYGCGNWLGFPKCQCTACIDEPCWDGSQRSLDDFCQCPPEYACDPAFPFPENKIWLGAPKCEFVCDPNLPECPNGEPRDFDCNCVMRVCDPIWPPPYPANQWLPYPDCKWVCNPVKCPKNQRWSKSQCKCVCNSVGTCSDNKFWDDNECRCKCREPCQKCVEPQVWSEKSCDCRCPKEAREARKLCNRKLTYWDEQSCSCACFSSPRECCDGKIWSNETCDCKCEFSCKCAPGFVWDPYTCNCVSLVKLTCGPINGVETYYDPSSGTCLCENAKYSRCMYGFDHNICSCRQEFCVQTEKCVKGFEWDKYQCKCISTTGDFPVCIKN